MSGLAHRDNGLVLTESKGGAAGGGWGEREGHRSPHSWLMPISFLLARGKKRLVRGCPGWHCTTQGSSRVTAPKQR